MLNLNINFMADGITNELRTEFMSAVCFETASMTVQMLDAEISRLNTQISNLQSNTNKSEEEKKVGLDSLNQKLTEKEEEKSKAEDECNLYRPSYEKVVDAMSQKNADHFGNNKDVVRTVLRVLGALDNSKLMKYAIIPAFQSPALYEALEAIHMNSKASEDGMVIASKEVKDAYKKASQELETIIKTTFSLPFETVYTTKTRVKLTAEDKKLLNDYIATDGAVVSSVDEINNFETLKAVADDIQAKKDDLGIEGAFASTGFDSSSDWRFKTHLANLPIYYEYKADGIDSTDAIKGTYLDNYKQIFDLYITDSTCEPTVLSSKTGEDAASEFALGEAVFYQNGTWAYNDIKDNEVADEDLGMLPIYIGVEGEENQGLCTGSENYWCVNNQASEEDIQATLDFLNWVITSDAGRTSLSQDMGFVTPFDTFTDEYQAQNPLVAAANEYIEAGKESVAWCFTTMPSENWKNGVGSALLEYAQGTGDWDAVKTAFVDGWATEYAEMNSEEAEDATEADTEADTEAATEAE